VQPSSVDCMVFGCTSTTAIIAYHNFHFFLVYLTKPLWQCIWYNSMTRCTWHNLYGKVYLIQFYDKVYLIQFYDKVYLIQLYDKVYLIQLLWQCVLDTSITRFTWYDQGVLDTTSMERCIWYSLYDKVHLIQLYGKVYLIQLLWQCVLDTSIARFIWYDQGVLDTTSMERCTWYNLYGKVYLKQPLWQGAFDTTSMERWA
jgi:hypothetical protein